MSSQYTRLRTLHSLSAFSDDNARVGDVPSSPTRSPLHLASLSSEPLGSPYTDGSPNTAAAGLGISELLRSQQETAVV